MKAIFLSAYLLMGTVALWAQYEPPALEHWDAKSPDGLYWATIKIIPDENGRSDLDTGRLLIARQSGPGKESMYVSYDIERLIAHIEWSPDSKFLVMTTVSAGGHSPWHFNSYVYCVEDKSLRYMDDVIGLVVDPKFEFVGPHTVTMKIPGPDGPGVDFENPRELKVDLLKQVPRMQKEAGKKEGPAVGK